MNSKKLIPTLLLVVTTVVGCRWRDRRDQHYLDVSYRGNLHQQQQTIRTTPVPAPPQEVDSPSEVFNVDGAEAETTIAASRSDRNRSVSAEYHTRDAWQCRHRKCRDLL